MLESIHYIFLGVVGFATIVWILSSMGIIKRRDDQLHSSKHRHIEQAIKCIEETYSYMENLPEHTRTKIMEHLDNGLLSTALETARTHHDVYHFFRNF